MSDVDDEQKKSDGLARRLANLKPFQPGQSGNPSGRPKSKVLSDAYRRELEKVDLTDERGRTFAEILAERAVAKAASGDVAALREIADRTEGKAKQTITLTLDKREQIERAVDRLMSDAGADGQPITRDEAIAALSLFMPEASKLIH